MASQKDLRGKRLGRYTLLEHLASGGMAEIFLARYEGENSFAKNLVLKVLHQRFLDQDEVLGMFLLEARLGALLNHPGIVDVYELGSDGGARFIAMEHIPGRTLTELVLRAFEVQKPLPFTYAAYIMGQVADALGYLQDGLDPEGRPLEIVHRDVSPTNIVISESGQTKLIDFGIAKRGREVKEDSGARPGKMAYMSPEQVRGGALDGRSDIFCLGTILYEITLGRRLWRGAPEIVAQRIVEERPPPPTVVQRDFPPTLELIIMKALEKRPQDRYRSAAEMAADLDTFVGESGERVSNRKIAAYLRGLYAPDLAISAKGARRAQAFLDDDGVINDEGSDALDFDRPRPERAAAALARALRDSGPLKILPAGAAAEEPSGQYRFAGRTRTPAFGSGNTNGRTAAASVGALAREPFASASDVAQPLDLRAAGSSAGEPRVVGAARRQASPQAGDGGVTAAGEANSASVPGARRGRLWLLIMTLMLLAGVAGAGIATLIARTAGR